MEEALKQNTGGLYIQIQKIGCFFRSSCRIAEYIAESQGKKCRLSVDELNSLWSVSEKLHYIVDNKIKNSAGIANAALAMLNVPGKIVEVATFQEGKMMWYPSVKGPARRADFYIQKIATPYTEGTHFRNVDKYGDLLWDPYKPDVKSTGIFYTICYRYDGDPNVQ